MSGRGAKAKTEGGSASAMKKVGVLASVAIWLVFSMGMGTLGGDFDPKDVPKPKINYKAAVVDNLGIRTELTEFSFDGQIFLKGSMGKAAAAIPFDKIEKVDFLEDFGKTSVIAKVRLKKEGEVEMTLSRNMVIFGNAMWGFFKIKTKDVKSIEILGKIE